MIFQANTRGRQHHQHGQDRRNEKTSLEAKFILFALSVAVFFFSISHYVGNKFNTDMVSSSETLMANYIHNYTSSEEVKGGVRIATLDKHRITPLDPTKKFSFVHIAKCAGATWIRLLHTVLRLDTSPKNETGDEFSVFFHKNWCCKDADYTLISLRSPRHHVWSQFIMCKYSPWGPNITKGRTEFPRSGNEYEDDEVDFDSWLSHFVAMGNKTDDDLNCYHPLSMQTRALTSRVHWPFLPYFKGGGAELSPNMTLAMNTYKDLDFVALVEFVHESECMLYYRLGNKAPPVALSYLSQSCHCGKQQVDHKESGNGTVHVQHHNMGKRINLRDLPLATLSKVANFISADSVIYVNALKIFMDEMAWLESDNALGRRVVCDDVLKKWEPELAYLDGGHFSVTQLYRDAVMKQQMGF